MGELIYLLAIKQSSKKEEMFKKGKERFYITKEHLIQLLEEERNA